MVEFGNEIFGGSGRSARMPRSGAYFMRRTLVRLLLLLFRHTPAYTFPLLRRLYWNLQAEAINSRWGRSEADYVVIGRIIALVAPERILDVGCGSGRLYPLYQSFPFIREIWGQDIARSALELAATLHGWPKGRLVDTPIPQLAFPDRYFDLVISHRVLQHIPPGEIVQTVRTLCRISRFVYINELQDSDQMPPTPYMFKHDYVPIFTRFGFRVKESGHLGKQTWFLFAAQQA